MFRRRQPRGTGSEGSSPGAAMRAQVLALSPEQIGLPPRPAGAVWGVVVDTAMSDTDWYALVVLADGTTSLYTSAAFGIVGAGGHVPVRAASERLLRAVEQHLPSFATADDDHVPPAGHVAVRALTGAGQRVLVAPEQELGSGHHAASDLFFAAHEVVTQLRGVTPP